jgi:poly [ADP-ribose] polymerase 2/3/4
MATLIREVRLIKTEVESNNNKFWHGFLYDDGTVKAEWGRVGYSGDSGEWSGGDAYLEKKLREKIKKGYTEQKVVGGITNGGVAPTVSVKNTDLHQIAKSQLLKVSNPILSRLIDRFVAANVHKITANTQITYNSTTGLFATPLGIVTMEGLIDARDLLAKIAPFVRNEKWGSDVNHLLSQYLRIIPQHLGMGKFDAHSVIPDDNAIQKQNDLIDSLESSYQAVQTPKTTSTDGNKSVEQVFKVDMDVLADRAERSRLDNWFEKSKKSMHNYSHLHVREIFTITVHEMKTAFDTKLNNNEEVWHGTSQANCLSILKSGLKTAPPNTAAIAGKLFGNGIYGAKSSTKSLGYSLDRWGQGGAGDSGWLFICEFAMGKIYNPSVANEYGPPSGYDSTWAIGGKVTYNYRTLLNDELIVYKNNQCNIKYLLEIK